jgi:hypothetical protein
MSAAHMLSKPARRCLAQRLERLHEALSGLARRLHESIASVVGEHAGGAIRDAVRAALGQAPESPRYDRPGYYAPYRDEDEDEDDRYRHSEPYRERDRPGYRGESYRTPDRSPDPDPQPARVPPRWWALLPAVLQALAAWLHRRPSRPALTLVGIAAAAGLVAVAAGPVAGVLAAAAGTALGLVGLAEGARDVAGGLASAATGST